MTPWILSVALILAVALGCYQYSGRLDVQIEAQRDQVKAIDERISAIKWDIPKITKLRDQQHARPMVTNFLAAVEDEGHKMAQVLTAVDKVRPAAVTVTHLSLEPGGPPLVFGFVNLPKTQKRDWSRPLAPSLPILRLSATAVGPAGTRSLQAFEQALSRSSFCAQLHATPIQSSTELADAVLVQIEIRCWVPGSH